MASDAGGRLDGDLPVVTAERAAAAIGAEATLLVSGFGSVGDPKAVPLALAEADTERSLTIVSGGSAGEPLDEVLVEAGFVDRRYPFQGRAAIRDAINDGRVSFSDRHVAQLGDDVQYGGLVDPDVALVEAVAVGEDWLVPSTSLGQTPAFVESADRLIVEVNAAQPRALERFHDVYRPGTPPNRQPLPVTTPGERVGGPRIEFDPAKLEAVVETDRRDDPYSFREPTDDDLDIAVNLRQFLEREVERSALFEESLRLQFGVGSLGNALMSALGDAALGGRDLVYFGEVIQDGLLDLLDSGRLDVASATSLALSEAGQDRLFANAERYAESVVLRPTDVSNSPTLIDRFGVVAVNSALEVDIYGHANSTNVGGSRIVSGVGGSGDFVHNAPLSIIALSSTAADGSVPRIVPMVPHVDHTEHDVDVVITEQGVADLRGCSPRERATRLVEHCAHPSFRDALERYRERAESNGGHEPHHLETAFSWTE